MIKSLTLEIEQLKNSVKDGPEEVNHSGVNRLGTDSTERERKFKLFSGLRGDREELGRCKEDYLSKYQKYVKVKKLVEELQ